MAVVALVVLHIRSFAQAGDPVILPVPCTCEVVDPGCPAGCVACTQINAYVACALATMLLPTYLTCVSQHVQLL